MTTATAAEVVPQERTLHSQHAKAARESYGFILIVGGILVLLNALSVFFHGRIDLTEKRLFSLSAGSERLASSLKDQMEIVAYFTENLPPPFNATERYVRDILAEYAAASEGKIRVRVINPNDDEKAQAAENDGVRKVSHQVVENDGVTSREGFRGIALRYLGESKAIPVVEDTSGLEYQLSLLIKEMVGEKLELGVVGGHDGPSLSAGHPQVPGQPPQPGLNGLKEATPTYDMKEVNLTTPIDSKLRAVIMVDPTKPFSDQELNTLKAYLAEGGSLGIFGGSLKVEMQSQAPNATVVDTGLNKLIKPWGLSFEPGMVADVQCGQAPLQTPFGVSVFVPYPPVPVVSFTDEQAEHPALFRLNQIGMPFTAPISFKKDAEMKGLKRTVLAKSTKNSWLLTGTSIPVQPRQPREWSQTGRSGPFALAVAVEGKMGGSKPARALVAGTGAMIRDEFLPQANRRGERDLGAFLAFGLNAIDWLAQDADLIAIRAKSVEDPALEVPAAVKLAEQEAQKAAQERDKGKVEEGLEKRKAALSAWESKKAGYRWFNTLGLPLAFAVFGLIRWRERKAKKAALKA